MNSPDNSTQKAIARSARDSFLSWEHLILLLTPFPFLFASHVGWILGLDNNAADRIWGVWMGPALFTIVVAAFMGLAEFFWPILFGVVFLFLFMIGRNFWFRRPKRLVLYAVVLLVPPAILKVSDADYLRFKLQESKFAALVAQTEKQDGVAQCFVFDLVIDNFYFGGMRFDPFEKLIIYVADGGAGRPSPRIDSFSSGSKCPPVRRVRDIRHLSGRYYLGIGQPEY